MNPFRSSLPVTASIVVMLASGCAGFEQPVELLDEVGGVTTLDLERATIHRYQGTDEAHVNSTIIETDQALVMIDAQHFLSRAFEVQRYLASLEKPLARIVVTSSRPEHYFGLPEFEDSVPVHAAPETLANMRETGESLRLRRVDQGRPFSIQYPDALRFPEETLEAEFVVDGIEYMTESLPNTAARDQIIIEMPALQALYTADILERDAHLVVVDAEAYLAAIDRIDALIDEGNYRYLLTARDDVLDASDIESVRVYVEEARDILADDPSPEKYRAKIEAAFPRHGDSETVITEMILAGAFD